LLTIEYKIKINSINKFDFNFDDEFSIACINADFYPYPDKIKNDSTTLLHECKKKSNISQIKSLVKKGIIPDINCLAQACSISNNYSTVKSLLDMGVVPNIKCLKTCLDTGHAKTIKLISEQYCDTHDDSICKPNDMFKNTIDCSKKTHTLTSTMIAFYQNQGNLPVNGKKTFSAIKKEIVTHVKDKKLITTYKLSFKIDKRLSCFGLPEGTIIQNHDIDKFISYIISYSPNEIANKNADENVNDDADKITIKKKKLKLLKELKTKINAKHYFITMHKN
jgi:hypothetical protein